MPNDNVKPCPFCKGTGEVIEQVTSVTADPTPRRNCAPTQPGVCPECRNSGYAVHPENGRVKGKRCSKGCRVYCSICPDPNCDNPGGQH